MSYLADINFTLTDGNLNRQQNSDDNNSGMLLYVSSYPSGLESGATTVYSLSDAKTLGLNSTSNPYEYYQVSEFYRLNPGATLHMNFVTGTSYTTDIASLLTYADGNIKQVGVFNKNVDLSASTVASLNTAAENALTSYKPIVIIAGFNTSGLTLSSAIDLAATDKKYVSIVLSQDGAGEGNDIFVAGSKSNPSVGACLGVSAKAKVNESIGWVDKYNLSNGTELEYPAFGAGQLVKNQADALLLQLQNKGYVFARKLDGKVGTYFNLDINCASSTSDYNRINKVKTINKAVRKIRTALIGDINSPLLVDDNGNIARIAATILQTKVEKQLSQMVNDEEIANFDCYVNPNQNVLSTNTVKVVVKILPFATTEYIEVEIGFTTTI